MESSSRQNRTVATSRKIGARKALTRNASLPVSSVGLALPDLSATASSSNHRPCLTTVTETSTAISSTLTRSPTVPARTVSLPILKKSGSNNTTDLYFGVNAYNSPTISFRTKLRISQPPNLSLNDNEEDRDFTLGPPIFSDRKTYDASKNILETPLYIDEEFDGDEEDEDSSERSSNASFSIQHQTIGDDGFASSHTPRTPERECFSALELPNI